MSRQETKTLTTRRQFLCGFLALGALSFGNLRGEASVEAATDDLEQKRRRLESQVAAYSKQKTTLTNEEIDQRLRKHVFVGQSGFSLHDVVGDKAFKSYEVDDPPHHLLVSKIKSGQLRLSDGRLNVIQTDLEDIGIFGCGGFYLPSFQALFVNKQTAATQARKIARFIYQRGIFREFSDPSLESSKKMNYMHQALSQPGGIDDISQQAILSYADELEKEAAKYRLDGAMTYAAQKTQFDYTVFHYFYHTRFLKKGYHGPPMTEILTSAISHTRQRFGNVSQLYDKVPFASLIQKIQSSDGSVSGSDKNNLSVFILEYLARIYNGALGYTPDAARSKFVKEAEAVGGVVPNFPFEEMFHQPSAKELNLLKRMKWQDKAIVF